MPHRHVDPQIRRYARELRREPTDEEIILWSRIRRRRFGVRFHRQVPIGRYIVDFACYRPRLVIEVDGEQHAWSSADAERDELLEMNGWRVIRFWNSEVVYEMDMVEDTIAGALEDWQNGIWPIQKQPPKASETMGG